MNPIRPPTPRLSIIVPVLDEAAGIVAHLSRLAPLRVRGAEVIVADGGSADGTPALAAPHADAVIAAPRGRAAQMNAGAALARAPVLLFLHADTRLPEGADALVLDGLARPSRGGRPPAWGRFDVAIEGRHPGLPVVAALMNARSRLTGIATGDQAIFARAEAFAAAGGLPDQPLMEDVALSRALKRLTPPLCLRARATTSGRRWDERGFARTVVLMWTLRARHALGADPHALARAYGHRPRDEPPGDDRATPA